MKSPEVTTIIEDGYLDQIGIVVLDIEKVSKAFQLLLGIDPFVIYNWPDEIPGAKGDYYGQPGNWKMKIGFAKSGLIQFELIQPISGNSIFQDFIDQHGPGLHHLRYIVPDIEKTVSTAVKEGFQIISKGVGVHEGSSWAYIDTRDLLDGVLLEVRLDLNK